MIRKALMRNLGVISEERLIASMNAAMKKLGAKPFELIIGGGKGGAILPQIVRRTAGLIRVIKTIKSDD
jgi:hypothetical protein